MPDVRQGHRSTAYSVWSEMDFGFKECLVAARYLVMVSDLSKIALLRECPLCIFIFEKHELICTRELWSESCFPGSGFNRQKHMRLEWDAKQRHH